MPLKVAFVIAAALTAPLTANAALLTAAEPNTAIYYEGIRAIPEGAENHPLVHDLGDAPSGNRSFLLGPAGLDTTFDAADDTATLFGRMLGGVDRFTVDVDGNLEISIVLTELFMAAGTGIDVEVVTATSAQTFHLEDRAYLGVFAGLTSFSVIGLDNSVKLYDMELVATPVPGTALLLISALGALAAARGRALAGR